jgi:predicted transcriptional regulator
MSISPLTQKNYSYLKLSDGKIYTFIRLVWLNDLLNHPRYKEFLDNFIIFWNWYKRETRKISIKQNGIIVETIELIDSVLEDIDNEKKEVTDKVIEYLAPLLLKEYQFYTNYLRDSDRSKLPPLERPVMITKGRKQQLPSFYK